LRIFRIFGKVVRVCYDSEPESDFEAIRAAFLDGDRGILERAKIA
jgi:hypothetical protein